MDSGEVFRLRVDLEVEEVVSAIRCGDLEKTAVAKRSNYGLDAHALL